MCSAGIDDGTVDAAARARSSPYSFLRWSGDQAISDRPLASKLVPATHRFSLLPRGPLRWLFIETTPLHLPEHTFPLHFLLQDSKCPVDVVVADEDLQMLHSSSSSGHCFRGSDIARNYRELAANLGTGHLIMLRPRRRRAARSPTRPRGACGTANGKDGAFTPVPRGLEADRRISRTIWA